MSTCISISHMVGISMLICSKSELNSWFHRSKSSHQMRKEDWKRLKKISCSRSRKNAKISSIQRKTIPLWCLKRTTKLGIRLCKSSSINKRKTWNWENTWERKERRSSLTEMTQKKRENKHHQINNGKKMICTIQMHIKPTRPLKIGFKLAKN